MIQVFTGSGRGKTLAAIGAAIRMAGKEKKIIFTQFLKDGEDTELKILQKIDKIAVLLPDPVHQQYSDLDEYEKIQLEITITEHFQKIVNVVETEKCDMLVLDEILDVCEYGFLNREKLITFLKENGQRMDIVLTGRMITHEVIEIVDYVSDIHKIKDKEEQCFHDRFHMSL